MDAALFSVAAGPDIEVCLKKRIYALRTVPGGGYIEERAGIKLCQ